MAPVFTDDTLSAESEVIGLRENSNGKTGVVYVRSRGHNQNGEIVLEYVRWVMVLKRDTAAPAPDSSVPDLEDIIAPENLGGGLPELDTSKYDFALAGAAAPSRGLSGR